MTSVYRNTKDAERKFLAAYDRTLQAWNIPFDSEFVITSFGKTHILVAGKEHSEPLFLFHGFAFSSASWIDNIPALSEMYRVYAVDFVGDINRSTASRPVRSKEDCAQWFRELLDHFEIRRTHIGGHSFGGFVALVLASYAPESISKVIAISPAGSFRRQSIRFFYKCLLAGLLPSTRRLDNLVRYMTGAGQTVNRLLSDQFITAMQNALPRTRLFPSRLSVRELGRIQQPVLLLIGDRDIQYAPEKAIKRAESALPMIETHLISNTGHGLPFEQPAKVNQLMLRFLSRKEAEKKA
ncbi:alpha/beta fold hydrolase [Sporolactobacillus vineae]|uniref:alpha/beta fold hydrolase n=1 Tax=Sporolactobacillus vineae TaxID=444463 RepID=UPI0002897B22|nr:alpha/beta hydrolase [Sporolactobacillus vineae]